MGIHSEFKYGITLYDFSFAFSNLKEDDFDFVEETRKSNSSFKFLASISKELFNTKFSRKKQVLLKSSWVLSCF